MNPTPTRKSYELRDGRISAVHFGDTSKPPQLVMLNANGFNGYSYKTILEPLGAHAIALDLRGHGLSELSTDVATLRNWHIFRDDIVEFFSRYIEGPVVLAGHSYGAVTAVLAMPKIKDKVSGYVGFDPVLVPAPARAFNRLPWGRSSMKKRLPIARNAGRRRAKFDSFEAAFQRYQNRGAFRGFTDEALRDYLTGGLIADGEGVKLACDPLWEQAIFVAQGHNVFKAVPYLPRQNSHVTFAGKHGAVSFRAGRNAFAKIIGAENVIFDKNRAHMFPMHDPDYATARLRDALNP
ncbi:alpha/beta hydrolase [Hellea balneolensis]|uniref:alpha/beta hydrolase n=1 Tax=Hellea balneolensis TaxID=287478 RepID=UPI00040BD63C|nr:alpha/beta hydrolase [Hellea balneolensis]